MMPAMAQLRLDDLRLPLERLRDDDPPDELERFELLPLLRPLLEPRLRLWLFAAVREPRLRARNLWQRRVATDR